MIDRKCLRKKLPHGYCKKISQALGITPQSLSMYFSGKRDSKQTEAFILKVIERIDKKEKELLDEIIL